MSARCCSPSLPATRRPRVASPAFGPIARPRRTLGDLDVAWLVLERLPCLYDPAWGAAGFSALLEAAARFQVFAAGVDTPLVYEEGAGTIRHWALGGREVRADAEVLLRHLDADWAWVTSVAAPEVMFGDLHFGNAVFRAPPPGLTAVLFDPIPRRQPWPFEPAYCEVVCGGSGLVAEMAAIRARPPGSADNDLRSMRQRRGRSIASRPPRGVG